MRRRVWIGVLVVTLAVMGSVAWAQATGGEAPKAAAHKVDYFRWFVHGGDWVGYILMILSVCSVALIIQHFVQVRKSVILPEPVRAQIGQMLQSKQYRELLAYTTEEPSLLSYIVGRALGEAPGGLDAMERAMEIALQERMVPLNAKPEVLAILGNTGPLLGLYGTVLGIVLAFSDIVAKGGIPEPGELAGSIGVALVATFWGLTVAIPSLVVYAIMKTRIEAIGNEAAAMGRELLSSFKPGSTKPSKPADKAPATEG